MRKKESDSGQLNLRFPEGASVNDLVLDTKNPRLDIGARSTPDELLFELARGFDLLELGESLVAHGYFGEEPLVVVEENGKRVVIEGNRRLAALRLLNDPSIATALKVPQAKRWLELAASNTRDLSQVPIITYDSRIEVVPFLGFRHITGVKKWDPLAKARFISYYVEEEQDWKVVARLINSKAPHVRDNYIAYRIVQQSRTNFAIDTERVEEDFSVLFRGLNETGIREFIGIDTSSPPASQKFPIPESKQDSIQELLLMMFGSSEKKAVLKESRDLHKLSEVLSHPVALRRLRSRWDLDEAFLYAGGEEEEILENLRKASAHLDQVNSKVHRHLDSEIVKGLVRECVATMDRIVGAFPKGTVA